MPDADAFEQDIGPEAQHSFPVVGVGASAGGLEALTLLLQALPADTGMAFVLVQHLAPSHDSVLAELLTRATSMPVVQVAEEPEIEPNHVYVIPPNRNMIIVRGRLRLLAREGQPHHPVDQFFRSLAENRRHMAIGVILSGTATDGTLGLEEIKAEGGITFAQDETAKHRGMPQSAVASGSVDFVLPPEGIAGEIARIAAHRFVAPGATDSGDGSRRAAPGKSDLLPILRILQAGTHVDITQYKENTLVRRITRRMLVNKSEGLEDYARYLEDQPAEVEALYQDILINVTCFFRDPEMFEALKVNVIPQLLKDRTRDDPLRVWVLGCSTGEEAYSLAMVLSEAREDSNVQAPVQIFATDLNLAGVERARAGVYSKERTANVSRERLRRFFVEVNGSVRVSKPLRDMCVFSRHNLMADPPFSRMDLVSCRNLLIYLEPALQQRFVPTLHYALKPKGFLILGKSETVGQSRDLFGVVDGKHRIYVKKPGSGRLPILASRRAGNAGRSENFQALPSFAPPLGVHDLHKEADRLLLGFAPAAVLVDANLNILEFRGNTEPYLAPPQGVARFALLKMARPGLLGPLRVLLQRAKKVKSPVSKERVEITFNDRSRAIDVKVLPVGTPVETENGYLVMFADSPAERRGQALTRRRHAVTKEERHSVKANSVRLERELASAREHLQALSDQHDAAVEALQAANEEAQSANEELQSINEEMETSKEELQSSNEELTTVNDELNSRNLELGQLNSDLTNLIKSVQVAIVIVGRDLRIRRFSPMAEKVLGIIPADIGRPLTDIRMQIGVPELEPLLSGVIDTVTLEEREVKAKDGRWYSLHVRPYVTQENRIDGAVLMMTDVDAIRRAREYAESIVSTVRDPILILDCELRVRRANRSFYDCFRVGREETEGQFVYEMGNRQWNLQELRRLLQEVQRGSTTVENLMVEREFEGIGYKFMKLNARRLMVPGEEAASVLLTIEDVTESKRADEERVRLESALRDRAEELDAANRGKADFIAVLAHELRGPLSAIASWAAILKRPDTNDDDRRKGLETIARNSRMQKQLISDLLDVQRIATGRLSLELRSLDLRDEIEAAIDASLPAAQDKQIRIRTETAGAASFVLADSTRLQQVLGNLLSNAIKFTPAGGEIRVALRENSTRAEVSVSDSGKGISPEALPHIFHRFRQSESPASRAHDSLGLGLAVSRELVELHGGDISAESPGRGGGARFTVSLPLSSKERPAVANERADTSTVSLRGVLVLIVDDEAEGRELARRILEAHDAEVLAVRSVDEALDAIQRQRPDVLVSDIGMPGRDGYYLIRAIRALPPGRGRGIPAIALTAFGTDQDRERALLAGYATHLVKPAEPSELVNAVAALLPSRTPDGPGSSGQAG